MDTVAQRMKHAREAMNLVQDVFAQRAGVSQSTIGNIESGARKKPREGLDIADAAFVRLEWLLRGEEPMRTPEQLAAFNRHMGRLDQKSPSPGPDSPKTVGERLTWAINNQQQKQTLDRIMLARSVGATEEEILTLESGGAENPRLVTRLANLLRTNLLWLLTGEGQRHTTDVGAMRVHGAPRTGDALRGENFRVIKQELEYREIPLLNYASAGDYCEAVENALSHAGDYKLIACPVPCGPRSFWIKVEGRSMTNPGGDSYPHGDMLAFDCDKAPVPGRPVLARLPTGECTLKNYEIDSDGTPFLLALNPEWPDRRTPMPEGVHVCASFVCQVKV